MTYANQPGSPSDPLHRRVPLHSTPHSPLQEYINVGEGYPAPPQAFGYDYERGSPSNRPSYTSPNMQGRHINMGMPNDMPPSGLTPTITFEYNQGGSQQHQQPGFFPNSMVDNNSDPNNVLSHDGGGSASPFSSFHQDGSSGVPIYLGLPQMEWQGPVAGSVQQHPPSSGPAKGGAKANLNKVPRHQFTACGACRHRRVKCDLRARQEEAEREAMIEDAQNGSTGAVRRRKVSCTNCQERGTNCVDEYAPLKAAKQLRRGKRISEIEMLYGKSATDAALASQGDDNERSRSPTGRKVERIPELTREFFDSPFFRRFIIQRPVIDSLEFVTRYLSKPIPCSAAMGPEGAVLCHSLYAWGISFGVDERGQPDVPEGGGEPFNPLNLLNPSEQEVRRDRDRQRRLEKLNRVVRAILSEMDECGLLRRPSWDGIRAILLILPLTEGISSPVERQAMYQAALSHVQLLCTSNSSGYDGLPVVLPLSPIPDDGERLRLIRMRIFWYAFVHESINVGLRGGNLYLDEDRDSAPMEQALDKQPLIQSPGHFHFSPRMAAATVRFALICRRIHAVVSGAKARRRDLPDVEQLHTIWEGLEQSWDEFEALKNEPSAAPFREVDEAIRFADSWKIRLFEAQNIIRMHLEDRLNRLQAKSSSMGGGDGSQPPSPRSTDMLSDIAQVRHLLELARTRCEIKSGQVTAIVRQHLGGSLFEWDAGIVRDGTYHAAMMLAQNGGSDEDAGVCLQALNESRWAYSKSAERSQDLRKAWLDKRSSAASPRDERMGSTAEGAGTGASSASKSRTDSPFTSPSFDSFSSNSTVTAMTSASASGPSSWPPTASASAVALGDYSPHHQAHELQQRSKSDPSAFAAFHHSQMMDPVKQEIHPHRASYNGTPPGFLFSQVQQGGVRGQPQQGQEGQYLLQPNGTHVFVPYGGPPMP